MIPHERSLVEEMEKRKAPFLLLGVNSDADPEEFRAQCQKEGVTWPSFFDGGLVGGPIATRFGVSGWPTIYILDKKGVIRALNLRGEKMTEMVETLLAEKE